MKLAALLLLLTSVGCVAADNVLPYTIHQGLMVVDLKVDDQVGHFLVDTGSNGTVITEKMAGSRTSEGSMLVINSLGGKVTAQSCRVMIALPHRLMNMNVTVMSVRGFDGIIGMDLLDKFKEVRIDFKAQTITLVD